MRSPLNAIKPFLVGEAASARERLAGELYNLDKLKGVVIEAANRGECAVKLAHDAVAVDLKETEAAAKLAEWIEENGMRLEWVERLADRPNSLKVWIREPLISWANEKLG
jgi:hypothetical protein